MKFTNFKEKAINTSYRHGNLYEVGSYVKNNDGLIGKVHRRGPNYIIAITEQGEMFRSWITDIKEYKQWNKSGDTADHRLVGTDAFRQLTVDMTPGSDYDMWKTPSQVRKNINKTKPIKEETMSATVQLSAWMLGLSRSEQVEIASKMDGILTSDDVMGGIIENFSTEKMQDLAAQYGSIVSGIDLSEGLKQARKNVGASKCWDGYKAKGTKMKDGKEVPNCVKEDEDLDEGKKGLYANIHAKRERGESPAKPGDEGYPAKDAFKKAAKTAKEEVEYVEEKKKLDPVGKEDGDVDNDGDKDNSDAYLLKKRAAVSAAMKSKKMKETFSDWRSELTEKTSKFVDVNPQIDDSTDPDSVFNKNKKLKGANNNMKEECGCEGEGGEDCGCEKCLAKKASKVKRTKYQDGVTEEVDKEKKENIVKGMKKNMKDLKARYGDRAKEVMYATANKMSKK